jgi:4-aminobutyrate aminotransferase-like enzyme
MQEVLRRGIILLPEGEHSEITGITPPLTITESQLRGAFREITRAVAATLQPPVLVKSSKPSRPRRIRS